jgi:hypothetical protein
MPQFLIESSHTRQECLKALDETLAKGSEVLDKFEYGCMSGDHRGWATVDAPSEEKARELVPSFLRSKTRVVQVGKFTPEQIRSYHQK